MVHSCAVSADASTPEVPQRETSPVRSTSAIQADISTSVTYRRRRERHGSGEGGGQVAAVSASVGRSPFGCSSTTTQLTMPAANHEFRER